MFHHDLGFEIFFQPPQHKYSLFIIPPQQITLPFFALSLKFKFVAISISELKIMKSNTRLVLKSKTPE